MNLIVIMLDSFRQDHIGVYHQGSPVFEAVPPCRTPNLDEFAESAVVFENAYPEALPTMPVRCALMTGQRTLPCHSWQPLLAEQISVAQILSREGYVSGMISDTYHYRAPGMNFHRSFSSYQWVRGQEYDPHVSSPSRRDVSGYVNDHFDEAWRKRIGQFLQNTDDFTSPGQWFPAKVTDAALAWLEANRAHKRILCWIDSFDPHEPWDPPPEFDRYTDAGYRGPRLIMPKGGLASDWATAEQIPYIQGLYAGEAAFVDHCLGRLFDGLERLGYYEDSIVLVVADHGHPLCDHGKFLKGPDRMYSELLKVPFIIRLPEAQYAGRRTGALVQFHDVLPTVLELMGFGNSTEAMHGRSFVPVLRGETDEHRGAIITGYHAGIDRAIRDRRFSYVERPMEQPDELYDLVEDPRETRNLIDDAADEARRLKSMFGNIYRREVSGAVKGVQGQYEMASSAVQ